MVELTQGLVGSTMLFTIAYAIFAFFVTIYSLWLNWKQSKVKETQEKQIRILEEIRDILRRKK